MTPVYLDTQWWVVTTSTCLDTATIVAVDVTRGTATSITLFDQDLSFRNYQQIMRNYIPLEQINVKSNYFKCCIYEVYNFCIFSSTSDYIEHGIHDLPPRKYICVWFSLSINFTKSDRFLSLQLNLNQANIA